MRSFDSDTFYEQRAGAFNHAVWRSIDLDRERRLHEILGQSPVTLAQIEQELSGARRIIGILYSDLHGTTQGPRINKALDRAIKSI